MQRLRLPEPFVTQPGIGSQGMERKILRSPRQFDFVDVDGFATMPHQHFLSLGFLFGGSDAHPDQKAIGFCKLFQSADALTLKSPVHHEDRGATSDKSAKNGDDNDKKRVDVLRDKE